MSSPHFLSSERSQSESRIRKLVKEGVGQERREPRERDLSVPTPLPLTPLVPPPLAHSGLEMRSRGGDILAYTIHGTADFIAIRIHYETKIRSTPNQQAAGWSEDLERARRRGATYAPFAKTPSCLQKPCSGAKSCGTRDRLTSPPYS
jgi:hypothetical protein